MVPPRGIEPLSRDPQSRILSVELWGRRHNKTNKRSSHRLYNNLFYLKIQAQSRLILNSYSKSSLKNGNISQLKQPS